jgi:mono/diheme cytochrome c family protein
MLKVKWVLPIVGAAVFLLLGILWLTGTLGLPGDNPSARLATNLVVPSEFKTGEALFNAHCTRCHGRSATGTDQGPSLLWKIYAPNHHSDASFYLAVQQGVRAHHWRFGNMLPIPEVTRDEVAQIIAYVRWLQEQVGVR